MRIANVGYRVTGEGARPGLIEFPDGCPPVTYSYAEIQARADAFGQLLQRQGLVPGDTVGVLADNSAAFLFLWLGALRAGLTLVPINHKLASDTIAHILRDASVSLVFHDAARQGLVPQSVAHVPLEEQPPEASGFVGLKTVDADSHAVILYTSGSTGVPKGVPMTQAGYDWTLRSRLRGGPFDTHRLLIAAPLYHINALGAATFTLAAGASMVLMPRFDARRYIEAIGRFSCTWLTSVPAMLAMVVRETASLAAADLRSVRFVRMGSSPISPKLVVQVRAAFPNVVMSNSYGTTEAGPVVFGPHPVHGTPPDGSAGWPLPDVEVELVDSEGRPADEGVLLLRTPANMKGYLNLPEKTSEVLSPDGWYRTGDIFRRDEKGAYWFVSRVDDMFVCGGENIYPQEVERLLESHPAVQQACVVPVSDDIKGAKPFAFVVLRAGHQAGEDEIKAHVLRLGPAYQHPRQIQFLDALPLAGTNKVDRVALAAAAARSLKPPPSARMPT
jgi:long-chain acyl-CoA synthetase